MLTESFTVNSPNVSCEGTVMTTKYEYSTQDMQPQYIIHTSQKSQDQNSLT